MDLPGKMTIDMDNKNGILIADDLEFARGILKMLLRTDYTVFEASSGEEALAALEKHTDEIACVLLDIRMPGVDGYEVMDCMRRRGFLELIPVIALTAIGDPKGHIRCYESGAVDIIEKPYNEELLLYKVRWTIDRFRRLARCGASPVPEPPRKTAEPAMPKPLREVAAYCREHFGLASEEEVESMVESFLRTFDSCAARLRGQLEEPDFMEVRDVGHDLTGFAAGSGAEELADLTLAMRTCAKAGSPEATQAVIRRILALNRTCHA